MTEKELNDIENLVITYGVEELSIVEVLDLIREIKTLKVGSPSCSHCECACAMCKECGE